MNNPTYPHNSTNRTQVTNSALTLELKELRTILGRRRGRGIFLTPSLLSEAIEILLQAENRLSDSKKTPATTTTLTECSNYNNVIDLRPV